MSKKLTTEAFIEKARKVHGDKYDYSNVEYKGALSKIKIVCPVHGIFEQMAYKHINQAQGCSKCVNEKKKKTAEQFIQEAKSIHGDKYDYSNTEYIDAKTKVKIICPIHGTFEQTPHNHLSNNQGCPKCNGGIKLSAEEFIQKAKEVHGDKYVYSNVEYKNAHIKVKIICPIHGIFEQLPNAHLNGQECPRCKQSHGEKKIRIYLENNNTVFEEQKKFKNLGNLSYDFFIPEKKLLIEYNGIQHYKVVDFFGGEKQFRLQKHHDWLKRKFARDNNYNLLTISYKDYNIIEKNLEE